MYQLNPSSLFFRKARKLIKKNSNLKKDIAFTSAILEKNPFDSYLKTHLVVRKNGEKGFSSFITGDLRMIWEYENKQARIIDIVDIGGHSGGKKVYK